VTTSLGRGTSKDCPVERISNPTANFGYAKIQRGCDAAELFGMLHGNQLFKIGEPTYGGTRRDCGEYCEAAGVIAEAVTRFLSFTQPL
jgi:hypothetical protein